MQHSNWIVFNVKYHSICQPSIKLQKVTKFYLVLNGKKVEVGADSRMGEFDELILKKDKDKLSMRINQEVRIFSERIT